MSARGCAAAVCGEPITKTIEVANGTKRRGMAERSASNSITAMAIAAPVAPTAIAAVRRRSGIACRNAQASREPSARLFASFASGQKKGGGPARSRRPLIVSMSTYFRLAIAVRSNLPATTKDEPHQLEPNPPGLIGVTLLVNRAFWSLVKALQSPLFRSVS